MVPPEVIGLAVAFLSVYVAAYMFTRSIIKSLRTTFIVLLAVISLTFLHAIGLYLINRRSELCLMVVAVLALALAGQETVLAAAN